MRNKPIYRFFRKMIPHHRLDLKDAAILTTLIIGSMISFSSYWVLNRFENQRQAVALENESKDLIFSIRRSLEDSSEELISIAGLYNVSGNVTRKDFRTFTQKTLDHFPYIQALEFVARVPHDSRKAFESKARNEGLKNFEFKEKDSAGKFVPAGLRDEYYVAYYIEPLKGNEIVLGFDNGTDPQRIKYFEKARETERTQITPFINLLQNNTPDKGFLMIYPIYQNTDPTNIKLATRRSRLFGFSLCVISVRSLIDESIKSVTPKYIDFYLYDITDLQNSEFIYFHPSRLRKDDRETSLESVPQEKIYQDKIEFCGRTWVVKSKFSPGNFDLKHKYFPWAIGLIGLFITLHLTLFLNERKHSEIHSKELQVQQKALLDNIPDIAWLKDKDSRFIAVNEPFGKAFNVDPQWIIGQDDFVICSREIAEKYRADDREVMATKQRKTIEEPLISNGGTKRWIETIKTPIFSSQGDVIGIAGIARDITERKYTDEIIRASENRYRLLAENVQDVIWTFDLNFRFTYLSPSVTELLGYKQTDASNLTIEKILTPDSCKTAMAIAAEELAQDRITPKDPHYSRVLQSQMVRSDGRYLWVESKVSFLRDEQGSAIGFLGVTRNISDRKEAEALLSYKTTLLEAQTNTTIEGILVVDDQGKAIFWNRRFQEIWSIPDTIVQTRDNEKMIQFVLNQLKYPELFVQKIQEIYNSKDKKLRDEIEFKDGRVFDRYSSPLTDPKGTFYGRIWYFNDISDRKRSENILKTEKENLRAIFSSLPVGMLLLNEQLEVVEINEVLLKLTKHELKEVVNRQPGNSLNCVHSYQNPRGCGHSTECPTCPIRNALVETLKNNLEIKGKEIQPTLLVGGHQIRPTLRISTQTVTLNNQKHIVVAVDDITDIKKYQNEKEELHKQLLQTEKMSAVGQLASGVAHEINNPLCVILGFAQSLMNDIKIENPLYVPIQSIAAEALRSRDLVQNLLTFSRVNKSDRELVDLNDLISSSLALIEGRCRMSAIEITKNLNGTLPKFLINKNQIQQALINLFNNASDAMPKGGRLNVETTETRFDDQAAVAVAITDSGTGISPEIQSKIFNPFFTTKEVGKGTGLGLALVYEIVQQHSGTIQVKSSPAAGSTFTLILPIKLEQIKKDTAA